MQATLGGALRRLGASVARCGPRELESAVRVYAPDLVALVGDAAMDGGQATLREMALNPVTAVLPVAVISNEPTIDEKTRQFRTGSVAIIARAAGPEEIAQQLIRLCADVPVRPGYATGEIAADQIETLVAIVSRDSRTGILNVESETGKEDSQPVIIRPDSQQELQVAVKKLRESFPPKSKLRFEFHESTGGKLDEVSDMEAASSTDLGPLKGIRLVIMDSDDWRAEHICEVLVGAGVNAAAADVSTGVLGRIREIDPHVIIVDSEAVTGPGFGIVRAIRRDPFLQWTSLLVVKWEDLSSGEQVPDLRKLAARINPLVSQDFDLRLRIREEIDFDTRLELVGPSRLLRAAGEQPGVRQLTIIGKDAAIRVDIADNAIVGAYLNANHGSVTAQGLDALGPLWKMKAGRVSIRERDLPSVANVMMPVDEVLGHVARQIGDAERQSNVRVYAATDPPQTRNTADCATLPPDAGAGPIEEAFSVARTNPPSTASTNHTPPLKSTSLPEAEVPDGGVFPATEKSSATVGRIDTQRIRLRTGAAVETGEVEYKDHSTITKPDLTNPGAAGQTGGDVEQQGFPVDEGGRVSTPFMAKFSNEFEGELATMLEGPAPASSVPSEPSRLGRLALLGACVGIVIAVAWWVFLANGTTTEVSARQSGLAPPARPQQLPTVPDITAENKPAPAPVRKAMTAPERASTTIEVDETVTLLVPDADLPDDLKEASIVLATRADRMVRRRKFPLAKATLDRALELDARNPVAAATMARLYLRVNDVGTALEWAQKAVARDPDRAASYLVLGDAHMGNGNPQEARKSWEKGLASDPDNEAFRLRLAGMPVD